MAHHVQPPNIITHPAPAIPETIAEELVGQRLTLRRYRIADAEELLAALTESRPRLRPWLGFHERILSLEAARDHLARDEEQWEARVGLDYGLRLHPRDTLIGELHIHTIDWNIPSFIFGYWMRSGYEGQGYMAEALRLAVEYLFAQLQAQRVALLCDARNVRSAAVAERVGFRLEGRLRNEKRAYDGVLTDTLVYALVPADRQPS